MYEIRFKGSKTEKNFKQLLKKLSPQVKSRLKDTLENNPYPSATHGTSLNKVERKGMLYGYEVSGGDRILYDVFETPLKAVLIHYAGDDDGEIRYLKSFAK